MKTASLTVILAAAALAPSAPAAVLGRLGQTIESTKILAAPSPKARVYYTAKAFQYMVVRDDKRTDWYQVFMSNGTYGYVPRNTVAIPRDPETDRPFNVVTKARGGSMSLSSGRPAGSATSRGSAAERALDFQGTPYKWGGNDLLSGIDCSGLVKELYGEVGVNLPRTAAEQATVGKAITRLELLEKGDRLYFWDAKRGKIGHTGIYLGNGYFVHSSSGKGGVTTDALNAHWRKTLVAARR